MEIMPDLHELILFLKEDQAEYYDNTKLYEVLKCKEMIEAIQSMVTKFNTYLNCNKKLQINTNK